MANIVCTKFKVDTFFTT